MVLVAGVAGRGQAGAAIALVLVAGWAASTPSASAALAPEDLNRALADALLDQLAGGTREDLFRAADLALASRSLLIGGALDERLAEPLARERAMFALARDLAAEPDFLSAAEASFEARLPEPLRSIQLAKVALARDVVPDDPYATPDPLALGLAAATAHARILGLDDAEPPRVRHASPSAAAFALLDLYDTEPTLEQAARIRALDALLEPVRGALTRFLNAHLSYDLATRLAYADADRAALLDMLRDRAYDDGMMTAATLKEHGLDFAPVLAARADLLSAAVALRDALDAAPVAASSSPLVQVPLVLSLTLEEEDDTYTDAYRLQFDAGGDDTYFNNAGGAAIGAAAAVDLGGDDDYRGREANFFFGVNGGGFLGSGFLWDDGGDDLYLAFSGGVNGGAAIGTGFLLDSSGNDAYHAGGLGANGGGAAFAFGALVDGGGNDFYDATEQLSGGPNHGTNGGGDVGSGLLLDAGGDDAYFGGRSAVNGGAVAGSGLLLDIEGNDEYEGTDEGVNGGNFDGAGFLLDLAGDDRYVGRDRGVNGGAFQPGSGALLDGGGNDFYQADFIGGNGGSWSAGVGLLLDGGGDDVYDALDVATNGGAFGGAIFGGSGLLWDRGGDDAYLGGFAASNGGGIFAGVGGLLDEAGNDFYRGLDGATNGGGVLGAGFLADLAGSDRYEAGVLGTNGGGVEGVGLLLDGGGDDTYPAGSGGTNGGGFLGAGFLIDQGGDDSYGKPRTGGVGGGSLSPGGITAEGLRLLLGLREDPIEYIVGFHAAPSLRSGDAFLRGTVTKVNPVLAYAVVSTTEPAPLFRAARLDPSVRYVEENGPVHALPSGLFTPDDPRFPDQYGPARIRAPAAWDLSLGTPVKTICVVDTGVLYTHEDLAGPRWRGGYDFINNDADPLDDNGHGTHVAGIAAATINNGLGIAGVSHAGILGVKVLDNTGSGTFEAVAAGVQWCADNGGNVISMSLGGPPAQVMEDAVDYAWGKGSLLVAAAGNGGPCFDCVISPASYGTVMAVTCTDRNDAQCAFSSDGPESEMAAPGRDVLSSFIYDDSAYETLSGTSMSTPHVSGVAALVWSNAPDLTNCQLRQLLRDHANDLGKAGWDDQYGFGLVDARATLQAALAGERPSSCASTAPIGGGWVGTNGGGAVGGAGLLVDGDGDDEYVAGWYGANGGGFQGLGLLADGSGYDSYSAVSQGVNGGGSGGPLCVEHFLLFLLEAIVRDVVPGFDAPRCAPEPVAAGFLVDRRGGDAYEDDDGGAGTDKRVSPKGTGAQLDMNKPPRAAGSASHTLASRNAPVNFRDLSVDEDGRLPMWRWDFGDGATSPRQHPSHTYGSLGTFDVFLTVTDDAGDSDTAFVATITVTNLPPLLSPIGARSVLHDRPLEFAVTATDPEGDALSFSADLTGLPPGHTAAFDPATRTFRWTPSAGEARAEPWEAVFAVSDGEDADSEIVPITVINRAPAFAADQVTSASTRERLTLELGVAAADPDGDALTLQADLSALPPGPLFVDRGDGTGVLRWMPLVGQARDTPYRVVFTARETHGLAASLDAFIAVGLGNVPPTVEAPPTVHGLAGTTLELAIRASDADGPETPAFAAMFDPDVPGDSFRDNGDGSATWRWPIPSARFTGTTATFTASDGLDSNSATVIVDVARRPDASISQPLVVGFGRTDSPLVGERVKFQGTATDPGGAVTAASFLVTPPEPGTPVELAAALVGRNLYEVDYVPALAGDYALAFTATDDTTPTPLQRTVVRRVAVAPNTPPVADAGAEVRIDGVAPVTLSGAASSDPEGRPLASFLWTQVEGPAVPLETMGDALTVRPLVVGAYAFELRVVDSLGLESAPDRVEVVVDDAVSAEVKRVGARPTVGLMERPVLTVLVRDDLGEPVRGAAVEVEVTHEPTGQVVSRLTVTTNGRGFAVLTVPYDSGTTPGANVPGPHTAEVTARAPSRSGAPVQDEEVSTTTVTYMVGP